MDSLSELVCEKHSTKIHALCLCPQGNRDPRICRHCEQDPHTARHLHKDFDYKVPSITVLDLQKLLTDLQSPELLKYAKEEHQKIVMTVEHTKSVLDSLVTSSKQFIKHLCGEIRPVKSVQAVIAKIKKRQWSRLNCMTIKQLRDTLQSTGRYEFINEVKAKISLEVTNINTILKKIEETLNQKTKQWKTDEQIIAEDESSEVEIENFLKRSAVGDKKIKSLRTRQVTSTPQRAMSTKATRKKPTVQWDQYYIAQQQEEKTQIPQTQPMPRRPGSVLASLIHQEKIEALEWLAESHKHNPEDENTLLNMAKMYEEMKNYSKAKESITRVLRVRPKHCEAFVILGNVHLESGNLQEAVKAYTRALQLDANKKHIYSLRAQAYEKLGKQPEAESDRCLASQQKKDSWLWDMV